MIKRTCLDCPAEISGRGNAAKRCPACANKKNYDKESRRAYQAAYRKGLKDREDGWLKLVQDQRDEERLRNRRNMC